MGTLATSPLRRMILRALVALGLSNDQATRDAREVGDLFDLLAQGQDERPGWPAGDSRVRRGADDVVHLAES